jgi:endoglycosylceramidase
VVIRARATGSLCAALALCACLSREAREGACVAAAAPLSTMRLAVDGRVLRDALGRTVLLRGVNAGSRSKVPPFFPFPFEESGDGDPAALPFAEAAAAYLDRVRTWGHNVVRLPFSWEALEPERGRYDDAFLSRYEALARAAGERGLRVLADFHQDVFARPYCGDGFPLWACPQPLPTERPDCARWFLGYLDNPDVRRAFDRFWANEDGLQDAFAAMWRRLAARLWPVDAVLGFEIINEPGWGTADPTAWARDVLAPFYGRAAAAIREVAPGAPIFFDATGLEALTAETSLVRPDGEALVFAPHYYDPLVPLEGGWTGRRDLGEPLARWEAQGIAWGVPVFLGEFGMESTLPGAPAYVRAHFDALDRLAMHGTLWEYSATRDALNRSGWSLVDHTGAETAVVPEIVRAYPRAVAGAIVAFRYDAGLRTATLEWNAEAGVTEIAAPARLYPGGAEVVLRAPAGCAALDSAAGVAVAQTLRPGRAVLEVRPRPGLP